MGYDLATFTRTARRLPYGFGAYRAAQALDLMPVGSLVVYTPDNDPPLTGEDFAARQLSPILYLGFGYQKFVNLDGARDDYLDRWATILAQRSVFPLAVMLEEEWYGRLGGEVGAWPCFAGMDEWAKRDRIAQGLAELHDACKQRWPGAHTIDVEPVWSNRREFGPGYYCPVPARLDVLGLDAYLTRYGQADIGTPPLTALADQAMLDKFFAEVGWRLEGGTWGGVFFEGAASYGRPMVLVAPAFEDVNSASQWSQAPAAAQLEWFYVLAQRVPAVQAVFWFAYRSIPDIQRGLDVLGSQREKVSELWVYNEGLS